MPEFTLPLLPTEKMPDRPSEMIRLAMLDISECSRDFRYEVEEPRISSWDLFFHHVDDFWDHVWHRPIPNKGTCLVCMAGAVMAKSLFAPWGYEWTPFDFEKITREKLIALEAFRNGNINIALIDILGHSNNPLEAERKIVPYTKSRRLFFRQMEKLADDLEEHGL